MVNILDVAKRAGVSKSTVSRVLNNNGYVAKDTKERIEKVMRELNYTPSSFAQNIRTRRSRTIAMMIPDASNTFYMEIFKVIEDVALRNDYMVILCDTRRSVKNELRYADKLLKRHIDGLLYFTQQRLPENERFFTELSSKIPVVFMDYAFAEVPGVQCVAMGGIECSAQAVEYLYGRGRRHIAYINLPQKHNVTLLRCDGYRQGLEKCGIAVDENMIVTPEVQKKHSLVDVGFSAARTLLKQNKNIDAIMTASDHLAVGAMKYLKSKGKKLPEDISIIGFDDTDICEIVNPALTTIRQPIKNMGKDAAQLLVNLILEKPVKNGSVIYKGEMIERFST